MSTFQYRSGLGSSAAYQVSGIPYLTASSVAAAGIYEFTFPQVTSFVEVLVNQPGRLGISEDGVDGTNYVTLGSGVASEIYDWRVTSIFISASVACNIDIRAGLTTIAANELSNNWSGSAGVG